MAELWVGDRVVLRASRLPGAEYVLFHPDDIVLESPYPGRSQETAYAAPVERARERLGELGYTVSLAFEAAELVKELARAAYARGPSVRAVVARLTPSELLVTDAFDSESKTYEGRYVDVAGLATDLGGVPAAHALQCLGLALLLDAAPSGTEVKLVTRDVTATLRSGERTFFRPTVLAARDLLAALRALAEVDREPPTPRTPPLTATEAVAHFRASGERATEDPSAAQRFRSLERLATLGSRPSRGPLADDELWEIEITLGQGRTEGLGARLERRDSSLGRSPGAQYLKARLALTSGAETPRRVAETAASLALALGDFHEAELLAAEAWLAAGEPRRAFAYARDLVSNASLPDPLRARAQALSRQVDDALQATPPPGPEARPHHPTVQGLGSGFGLGEAPTAPAVTMPPAAPALSKPPSGERLLPAAPSFKVGASRPPFAGGAADGATPAGIEIAESLAFPPESAREPLSQRPRTPGAMRRRAVDLTRDLARELREREGDVLVLDLGGLERVQSVLRERLQDPDRVDREGAWLVERAGAFLSELLARRLEARWTDLAAEAPGHWTMTTATGLTVWPFGRVARFVERGHTERDLVSWVLELEGHGRRP